MKFLFCNNFCAKYYFYTFQSLTKQSIQDKNNMREYRSLLVILTKHILTLMPPWLWTFLVQ
ncbi:TPA: hypothetical protein I7762_09225 [Vibrio vulnificus]|nr:hypothetical protein [Vibrio vulnificus]HAS8369968.1 hypothetical protein [Vibrio vulnificus]HAS8373784.1 hypothetical protein [Vibrio vulnificus]HAS8395872.1 hypothetical protein [Vibrio vulnificus]